MRAVGRWVNGDGRWAQWHFTKWLWPLSVVMLCCGLCADSRDWWTAWPFALNVASSALAGCVGIPIAVIILPMIVLAIERERALRSLRISSMRMRRHVSGAMGLFQRTVTFDDLGEWRRTLRTLEVAATQLRQAEDEGREPVPAECEALRTGLDVARGHQVPETFAVIAGGRHWQRVKHEWERVQEASRACEELEIYWRDKTGEEWTTELIAKLIELSGRAIWQAGEALANGAATGLNGQPMPLSQVVLDLLDYMNGANDVWIGTATDEEDKELRATALAGTFTVASASDE